MTDRKHIEKTCEILAKRKHNGCTKYGFIDGEAYLQFNLVEQRGRNAEKIEPFEPTLAGMKQAHTLEDYLMIEHPTLWHKAQDITCTWHNNSMGYEMRLCWISWCIGCLVQESEKPKGDWVAERSSGYDGFRCQKCMTWIYGGTERKCKCDDKKS